MRPKNKSLNPITGKLGTLFLWPLRWLTGRVGRLVAWLRPIFWEELGRLGLAARRVFAILAWPLLALARFVWRGVLTPLLKPAAWWLALRARNLGRAWRSGRPARRAVRQRVARWFAPTSRLWFRLAVILVAVNVMLIYLLVQLASSRPNSLAGSMSASPAVAGNAPSATPFRLPTATPTPSPIPITPAPTPDRLAMGGSVAYVKRTDGNDDIYAISVGQEKPIRLTFDPADDRDPAWSPDGRRLAFASRRDGNWELYLLDIASGRVGRLTYNVAFEANPTWSPDGQWIAYETYVQDNLNLFILPVAGGEPIQLTHHPAADYEPAWSPSGRHIAFISWRSGNPDIWLFSLDDARDEAAVNITNSPDIDEDHPAWHPGGDYLAFSGQSGSQHLVYAQPMLNNLPADRPISIGQGSEPTWAPNGGAVLYSHDESNQHYLLAGQVDGWGVAPEVFQDDQSLRSAVWQAATLPLLTRSRASAAEPLYLETVADPAEEDAPYTLVTVDNVQVSGPYLSDRVDLSYIALRQQILEKAGWDILETLDKMWEPMDALPPPGLEAKTWNMAGRAFDIVRDYNTGTFPQIEVCQELGEETYWRLYIRAERQDGSQGEPLRSPPWNFAARYSGNSADYESGGRAKSEIPAGYYVDLTELAADYGWERQPSGRAWRTYYPATLFWHFEKRQELSWEEAMLELYSAQELVQTFGEREP